MDVRDGGVIVALGFALLVASLADGELLHGYGVGPSAALFHVGLLYVVLGVGAISLGSRRSLLVAVGVHAAFFVLACALMYYDLVLVPPEYGTVPSVVGVVVNRAQLALALLPVTVGYLAGAPGRAGKWRRETPMFVVAAGAGPVLGLAVALSGGAAPGFTHLVFAFLGLGAFVTGVPLYLVASRGVPER
jgi:hypothetical protein